MKVMAMLMGDDDNDDKTLPFLLHCILKQVVTKRRLYVVVIPIYY